MAIECAIAHGTIRTSGDGTGTKSYEVAGFGTPQLAIIMSSMDVNDDGTSTDHSGFMMGATDGTNDWCATTRHKDALATSDTFRYQSHTGCLVMLSTVGAVGVAADFDSWATNGVTLDFTTADFNTAMNISVILFKGLDSVNCHQVTLGNEGAEVHVNGLGFEPDLLIVASDLDAGAPGAGDGGLQTVGFVHNGDSVTERCIVYNNEDAEGNTKINSMVGDGSGNTGAGAAQVAAGGGLTYTVQFQEFDADGYSAYARDGNSGGDIMCVVAMACATSSFWVGSVDPPTSADANVQITSPGFEPELVMQGLSMCAAYDTIETDDDAGSFAISAFTDSEFCSVGWAGDDGPTTSNEISYHDTENGTNAILLKKWTGAAFDSVFAATFDTMLSTGWQLDYSAADGTQRKWIGLAIGAAGAVPQIMHNYQQQS